MSFPNGHYMVVTIINAVTIAIVTCAINTSLVQLYSKKHGYQTNSSQVNMTICAEIILSLICVSVLLYWRFTLNLPPAYLVKFSHNLTLTLTLNLVLKFRR